MSTPSAPLLALLQPPPKQAHRTPFAQPLSRRQVPAPAGAGRPAADQRLLPRAGAAQRRVRRLHRAARVRPALGGRVRRHARRRGLRARGGRGPHLAGAAPVLASRGDRVIVQSWGLGVWESMECTWPALRHVRSRACCKKSGTLVSTAIGSPAALNVSTAARAGCTAQMPVLANACDASATMARAPAHARRAGLAGR